VSDAAPPAPEPATPASPPGPSARTAALRAGAGALAFLGLVFVGLYLRGTRVSTTPLFPRPAAGPVRQLGQGRDGPRVEAALVIERPLDEVWAVVTDYAHFGEIFHPPLWTLRVDEVTPLDGDRYRLRGEAVSRLSRFPIDVTIEHRTEQDARIAAWDASAQDGGGAINRGRWVLLPLGPSRTQVVYEAEVRAPGYPAFLVNDLLLSEVGTLLTAVRDRLDR
jgi:uncharacterized membrane protein